MRIILATGGTGGHVFPALRVAEELKKDENEILFVGSFSSILKQMQQSGFRYKNLKAQGLRLGSLKKGFVSIYLMIKAVLASVKIIKCFKPDVVLGFGGYGAFPAMLAAVFFRKPTIIHEQNVIPGRANVILSKVVRKIAISFKEGEKYFDHKKTVLTGCPCKLGNRALDREESLNFFNLENDKITILVFGGSQGSQFINKVFMDVLIHLKEEIDFQVIHIWGKGDFEEIKREYSSLGISVALFKFLDKMDYAYRAADLVISRSGAATISEIMMARRPAILIPYPHAVGGHQKANALVLEKAKIAKILEEKDLTALNFKEAIIKMINSPLTLKNQKSVKDICFFDAAIKLKEEVYKMGASK